MSLFALPTQSAVYTRLNAELSCSVYDDVPDSPVGAPEANFPYAVIGEYAATPWDTDDTLGNTMLITVHVYSRYSGNKQVKELMQEVYNALNRQHANLSAAGYRFVDCLFSSSNIVPLGDGKTRQGICRYIITIEKE